MLLLWDRPRACVRGWLGCWQGRKQRMLRLTLQHWCLLLLAMLWHVWQLVRQCLWPRSGLLRLQRWWHGQLRLSRGGLHEGMPL